MNTEYHRLEAEASEVQQQIDALVNSCGQIAAAEFRNIEADLARLNRKLTWLRPGMAMLKMAGSRKIQEQSAKIKKSQPKTFHSHGAHPKTVQLTGGVTVTLNIGEMLTRLTKLGSLKFSGNAAGRRMVVATDGGQVHFREKHRGRQKKPQTLQAGMARSSTISPYENQSRLNDSWSSSVQFVGVWQ